MVDQRVVTILQMANLYSTTFRLTLQIRFQANNTKIQSNRMIFKHFNGEQGKVLVVIGR